MTPAFQGCGGPGGRKPLAAGALDPGAVAHPGGGQERHDHPGERHERADQKHCGEHRSTLPRGLAGRNGPFGLRSAVGRPTVRFTSAANRRTLNDACRTT